MNIAQLPRDASGVVTGQWRLKHRHEGFSESLGFVNFVCGETTAPLTGGLLDRVMAAFGASVEAFPWDDEPESAAEFSEPPATAQTASQASGVTMPTTAAELMALSEDDARELAAELGLTDRRVRANGLRRFLARELGIEGVAP